VTHPREHEWLLMALLERPDPRAAWRASAIAGCTECERHLQELIAVRSGLDALGTHVRAAVESTPVPGDELVERVLGPRLRRRPARLGAKIALIAALFLACAAFFWLPRAQGPDTIRLGAPALVLHPPPPGTATFSWTGALPVAGWYEVTVIGTDGHVLARTTLEDSRWIPSSMAGWPADVRWQVALFDGSGHCLEVRGGRASLSSR
jgi:anti-sigma factor RsiW